VGAVDAIVDIVGAAIGVETLGITQLYASALPLTTGHVIPAHGLLPVLAPATLEILRRVSVPWKPRPIEGERVTPTGAVIRPTLARFETPFIAIERVGYGFGQKRLPWPNCLRLCLGQTYGTKPSEEADTDWVTVLESNIDTMSGELLGGMMERLLAAGALDVSYSPLQMKKNRPGVLVRVLARPEDGQRLAELVLVHTSALGARVQTIERLIAQRSTRSVDTPWGRVRVKVKHLGQSELIAPEYEDCARVARAANVRLSQVYAAARAAEQRT